jgi:hypothetical protein
MNFKLKALVAAAVATMTLSGAANAVNNNDLFLVAYDATNAKTFIAGLSDFGTATGFNGTATQSRSFAADANWTNFLGTNTAGTGINWQVLGIYQSNASAATSYNAADEFLTTATIAPGLISNSQMNGLMADWATPSGAAGQFQTLTSAATGTASILTLGGGLDTGANVKVNVFGKIINVNAAGNLGDSLAFWDITRPAASGNIIQQVKTQFVADGGIANGVDTWSLGTNGVLTYTNIAAVPEADTSAMMLAGLGLMGFVARRRRA